MEAVTRLRAAVLTGMDHAHIVMPLATICGLDSLERVPCKSQSVILAQCEEARQPWLGSSLIGHWLFVWLFVWLFGFLFGFLFLTQTRKFRPPTETVLPLQNMTHRVTV